jgi:hypothetical protein
MPAQRLAALKTAVWQEANGPLRAAWHTPRIVWRNYGETVTLSPLPEQGGVLGFHTNIGAPNAVIYTGNSPYWQRSYIFAHEVLEMLVDPHLTRKWPDGSLVEVCDPVLYFIYAPNGVHIADFVTPRWFNFRVGPWDYARLLKGPHE